MMNNDTQRERIRGLREGTIRLEHEGDYWTNQEKEILIRDFNSGVGIAEMAGSGGFQNKRFFSQYAEADWRNPVSFNYFRHMKLTISFRCSG